MSLRCTSFGWQGWLFETPRARLLTDPLLLDEVGRGPRDTRANFHFPAPRELRFDRFPAVDAVFITHEHEDHFNVPTLARLDRRIPLYVSGLVSSAAKALLSELGFSVTYVEHGQCITIQDLELYVFGVENIPPTHSVGFDEWDTFAYIVKHTGTPSPFFTNVDIAMGADMRATLEKVRGSSEALGFVMMKLLLWNGRPLVTKDGEHSAKMLKASASEVESGLHAGQEFPTVAGLTFDLGAKGLERVTAETEFLRSGPSEGQVPRRPFMLPAGELPEQPVVGQPLPSSDGAPLEAALRELAQHLYGRRHYQYLIGLQARYRGARKRTFAIAFLEEHADGPWVYEYVPSACDFQRVALSIEEAGERYVGLLALFASDFLALTRGEVEPRAIQRGIQEDWALEDSETPSLSRALWSFYHPQRFPDRVLAQYRRALELEKAAPICVRAR
jgi:phosphoribosyl 1,2-cyclic phosphodiesterase